MEQSFFVLRYVMEFSGYIKAVRYKNEENGYTVASMETEDGDINIVGYFS